MPLLIALVPALLLACHGKTGGETGGPVLDDSGTGGGLPTPEQVVASAAEGDTVHFSGVVHALTFDSIGKGSGEDDEDTWSRLPGRWLLVWSAPPAGVQHQDLALADIEKDSTIRLGWGLGIALDPAADPGLDLPRIGETVEVSGTFHNATWNGHPVPVVEDPTLLARSGSPLLAAGQGCSRDTDCIDSLVCDRASQTCAPATEIGWGSLWRDVDGHCYADADCPLGQVCDTSFVVADKGEFSWRYDAADKQGASICVPEQPEDALATCGRIDRSDDLAGGRYTEGKELCIRGTVALVAAAEDGDSHVQLQVDEPIPYPAMDADIFLFGATTEIGPPYKDPARPQGAQPDPAMGQEIIALGTYRWDGGHGWFEVHPLKQWWPAK